jgi:hypothetical protein
VNLFTVYKTEFLLTGQYYYGVHETATPQDRYLGSGIWIKRAVRKHGRDHFRKIVLFIFSTEPEAYAKETELIKAAVDDPLCMNMHEGGKGGFHYINENGLSDYLTAAKAGAGKHPRVDKPLGHSRWQQASWRELDMS